MQECLSNGHNLSKPYNNDLICLRCNEPKEINHKEALAICKICE